MGYAARDLSVGRGECWPEDQGISKQKAGNRPTRKRLYRLHPPGNVQFGCNESIRPGFRHKPMRAVTRDREACALAAESGDTEVTVLRKEHLSWRPLALRRGSLASDNEELMLTGGPRAPEGRS